MPLLRQGVHHDGREGKELTMPASQNELAVAQQATNGEPASAAQRVDFRGADLRGMNMEGVNLEGADLRGCDLRGVNFTGRNLRYADLRGASLQGACFQNASLYGARMQGVEAQHADFRGADMRLANLGGAYTEGAMMVQRSPAEIAQASGNRSGQDGGNAGNAPAPPAEIWRQDREKFRTGAHEANAGKEQNQQAGEHEQGHSREGR